MKLLNPVVALAIGLAAGGALAGPKQLYKWVDEKGHVFYSERMPPEYKDASSTELDRGGRVLRKNEAAPTAQTLKAREEEAVRRKADEKRLYEQKRRDTALMNTYTSETEIDQARDRSIALPQQALRNMEPRLKAARANVDTLRKQPDVFLKAGKPVPDSLKEDIAAAERDLAQFESEWKAKEAEVISIRERYEADKLRYRELSAFSSTSSPNR
ncbi:MAG: DUF4124 domain-containing protein [Burkholderiales bacterium]|nr:DUF4124 domain-containing protein [Burkholderiales bacterium]